MSSDLQQSDEQVPSTVPSSYIHLVEPATDEDLRTISDSLKLGISDADLSEYREWVNSSLAACDSMRDIPEATIPVLYPRIPGVKPASEDNPCNAWASRMTLKGEASGLLAGKKIAVKDNIFIAGTPLQNGSKLWDGYTPEFDATVVTRILKAGGTLLGKSTCENQCFSGGSFTSSSGPVLNPHDKTRQTGGSSSGSAALIVLGEVDMALGGDQGGSVRLPSCWSGCVGLKPTWGLVPVTGSLGMEPTFDHIGPMAATVSDVALLLQAIAGYDAGLDHRQHPNITVPQYSDMLTGDLKGKKFGYVTEGFLNVTPGVKSVIDGVVDKMKSAGAVVDVISIPEHERGGVLFTASMAAFYKSVLVGQGPGYNELYNRSAIVHLKRAMQARAHDMQPVVKAVMLFGEYIERKDGNGLVAMAMNQRPWLRAAYDKALESYDGLIMPTIPCVARALPKPNLNVTGYMKEALINTQNTGLINLSGHPALSLSVGKALPEEDDGQTGTIPLPVGLQIVGKKWDEANILNLGYGIERLIQA